MSDTNSELQNEEINGRQLDSEIKAILRDKQRKDYESGSSIWSWFGTPLWLAVITAFLGVISATFNWHFSREIEQEKLRGSLILDSLKTGTNGEMHLKQASANLVLLHKAKLVVFDESVFKDLDSIAGNTPPGLPSTNSQSGSLPADELAYLRDMSSLARVVNLTARNNLGIFVETTFGNKPALELYIQPESVNNPDLVGKSNITGSHKVTPMWCNDESLGIIGNIRMPIVHIEVFNMETISDDALAKFIAKRTELRSISLNRMCTKYPKSLEAVFSADRDSVTIIDHPVEGFGVYVPSNSRGIKIRSLQIPAAPDSTLWTDEQKKAIVAAFR